MNTISTQNGGLIERKVLVLKEHFEPSVINIKYRFLTSKKFSNSKITKDIPAYKDVRKLLAHRKSLVIKVYMDKDGTWIKAFYDSCKHFSVPKNRRKKKKNKKFLA